MDWRFFGRTTTHPDVWVDYSYNKYIDGNYPCVSWIKESNAWCVTIGCGYGHTSTPARIVSGPIESLEEAKCVATVIWAMDGE